MVENPNPVILREYDIRGTFGLNLFEESALWLGQRFGSLVKEGGGKTVSVCCDGRISSPALKGSLIKGLCDTGLTVIDIGVGPTPMSYFSGHYLKADATLMVTGSHNPKDDNGVKITLNNRPFFSKSIQDLQTQKFIPALGGECKNMADEVFNAYAEKIFLSHNFQKPLKIAWDAGNGAAGGIVEKLVKLMPQHEHVLLFTEIDGDFPNHHPDPSVSKNLEHIRDAILQNCCDIGFAFDGDGDRVGVVDSKGRILSGDQLTTIIAEEILQQVPKATIIADVKCSDTLFQKIKLLGGNAIMERTGHAWIKESMREKCAAFAGEMSGHMFFSHNYYGFDDGLYAAVFLINLAQKAQLGFCGIVDKLPKQFSTPEIRLNCDEDKKAETINEIKKELQNKGKAFLEIDGVRVVCENGWWLVRASNTQSALIVRAESKTDDGLLEIIKEMERFGVNISDHIN